MRKLKNVTILGAGTAGWISAYILSDFFYTNKQDVKVTIVDPSSIPIIGVGEGTTGIFYDFLKRYNLDELDAVWSAATCLMATSPLTSESEAGLSPESPLLSFIMFDILLYSY